MNIPSILLKAGDTVSIKSGSLQSEKIKAVLEANGSRPTPNWLERVGDGKAGKVVALPTREEIDTPVEESLIVELYSK